MLLELVVSTLLVGVLMTAALAAAGQSLFSQRQGADRIIGRYLAQSLLDEVLSKEYKDPDSLLTLLGVDLLESLNLRSSLDDVDDYDGYTESPPQDANGSAMNGYAGWRRSVQVVFVNSTTLAPAGVTETGVKRVTVSVSFNNVPVYTAVGFRTARP